MGEEKKKDKVIKYSGRLIWNIRRKFPNVVWSKLPEKWSVASANHMSIEEFNNFKKEWGE